MQSSDAVGKTSDSDTQSVMQPREEPKLCRLNVVHAQVRGLEFATNATHVLLLSQPRRPASVIADIKALRSLCDTVHRNAAGIYDHLSR